MPLRRPSRGRTAGGHRQPANEVASAGLGVMRRPILVVETAPDRIAVVDRNRIIDAKALHGGTDIVDVPLERELRRVDPDDDRALVAILLRAGLDIGQRAQAVDAGIGPEIGENDVTAQPFCRHRRAIQPIDRTPKRRELPLNRQLHRRLLRRSHHNPARVDFMTGAGFTATCAGSAAVAFVVAWRRSRSVCSIPFVLASDTCVSSPPSRPGAMATTPARTATPSPRRIHSPRPRRPLRRREDLAPDEKGHRQ